MSNTMTLESIATEAFDVNKLACVTKTYRNKPSKNRNGRHAIIEAKRKGLCY